MIYLTDLLQVMVLHQASDLIITAGRPPVLRVNGILENYKEEALSPLDTKRIIFEILTKTQQSEFEKEKELDFSYELPEYGRFRINIFYQKGTVACAIRAIPDKIPSPSELHIPKEVMKFCELPNGLVLVTGPTGSGKSTTLASMIEKINEEKPVHIITLEDPIEYVHKSKKAVIEQREIHTDTHSFQKALRHILRQSPDVILIGEMRDLETISAALTLAETGHLVFGTLHTINAVKTIDRIIDVFPANQQNQIRTQLSLSLRAVVSQQLILKFNGKERIPAFEVMIVNHAISQLIREGKSHIIYSQMQTARREGMITMNQSLAELVKMGFITRHIALSKSQDKTELSEMLKGSFLHGRF